MTPHLLHYAHLYLLTTVLVGCAATRNHDMPAASDVQGGDVAPLASARVALRTPSGAAAGQATLTERAHGGVHIRVEVRGMAPGDHGFHIHANGSCAPGPDPVSGLVVDFGGAGGHFDPHGTRNHGQPGQSPHEAHAGEAPNISVGPNGQGTLDFLHPHIRLLPGNMSVLGRSLVVHDKEDDYASDPAGNSGGRIACGVIESATSGMVQGRAILEGTNVFPEGIAVDPRSGTAYVGSSSEGHIFRIVPGAEQAESFQMGGSPGRQGAFGMKVDDSGRLWVAGGPGNTVAVLDLQRATTLAVIEGPKNGPQGFLNDLVITGQHAYVTDSFRPVLWRIATAPGAVARLEPWLDLRRSPIRYQPNEINLNGIVASADGRWLLTIQLVTGQLWRIDAATGEVNEVRVDAGSLIHGDGLVLLGPDELVVMRNADNELVRLRLAQGWGSSQVVQRVRDPRLKYPTTAAMQGSSLLVVNGQLDKQKAPPPLLPFDVVRIGVGR